NMRHFATAWIVLFSLATPVFPQSIGSPFIGRWDFDLNTNTGTHANWLGITEKNGNLELWFQPTGGHVHPVKDFHVDGSHLTLTVSPASGNRSAMIGELDAAGGQL